VRQFEAVSKRLALASLLVITFLQVVLQPDATAALRVLAAGAFLAGWIGARAIPRVHLLWLVAAPLAPALLRLATGREGPVLDMFWMAGLSAVLLRRVSWSSWALPHEWKALAGGWALTVALAWPILVAREAGFDAARLIDHGAINSSAPLSAAQATSWILYVAWMHLLGLIWLDWSVARFSAREETTGVVDALWIGTTIAGVVALYQGIVDLDFLSTNFWASNGRATGTLLDANAYGWCAAIAGPIAFAVLHSRGATSAATAVLLVNLAGLWMSGARVAALCAGIGVAALLVALWKTLDAAGRRRLTIGVAAAATGVAVLVLAADAIGPIRRIAELPDTPRGALAAALFRGEYGRTAVEMIRDYPLSGVGIGSYQIFAADYWRQLADDVLQFDTSQNWWRHEAAELGLFGSLSLFLWSGLLAWTLVTARAAPGQILTATVVRGVLIALGVCSIVQMPTNTPIVLLWFLLLLAWFMVGLRDEVAPSVVRIPRLPALAWVPAALLAVAYAATHALLAAGPLDVAERARRMGRPYIVGTYPEEVSPEGTAFRWTRAQARFLLPRSRPWLVLRVWAHHPDVASNPVTVTVSTLCGPIAERTLSSAAPIIIPVRVPDDDPWVDVSLAVSRTFKPSDYDGGDSRQLGAGVTTTFANTLDHLEAAEEPVVLQPCRNGGS
jgi:hypothetical protein